MAAAIGEFNAQGLNRLRKKALFVAKRIPQGLKPNSFYWLYRHD
jgi:hypothetical protein